MAHAICIYCQAEYDPSLGDGDHVVPMAFGDFNGAIKYRGLCRACNNRLGKIEEELIRSAPEAVARRHAGATTSRQGKQTGWRASSSSPPPKFAVRHATHTELFRADPQTAEDGYPLDQIVIVMKDGSEHHVQLFAEMSAAALHRKIEQLKICSKDIECTYWHWNDTNSQHYRAILSELWPNHRWEELPSTDPGVHRVGVRIRFQVTQRYYQAIAKIALHYYLATNQQGFSGHERQFNSIRKFVMDGGDEKPFFEGVKPKIALPFGLRHDGVAVLPARWLHLLCGIETAKSAVIVVFLFIGPKRLPQPHYVTIFNEPSRLFLPIRRYSNLYVYGDATLGDEDDLFVVSD